MDKENKYSLSLEELLEWIAEETGEVRSAVAIAVDDVPVIDETIDLTGTVLLLLRKFKLGELLTGFDRWRQKNAERGRSDPEFALTVLALLVVSHVGKTNQDLNQVFRPHTSDER